MKNLDSHNINDLYAFISTPSLVIEKYYNDQLNPKFWQNNTFDEHIREKLLVIAREFYDQLKIELPIIDIQLTGSLANYNYTDHSDLDVHILIDFSKINKDVELVKKGLDGLRFIWNLRHNITIKGHDVELYVQDINEPHTASGLYSLLKGEWIRVPSYNPPEIDEKDVITKYKGYVSEIEEIERLLETNLSEPELRAIVNRIKKFREKIQQDRRDCLATGNEFCVENLVFKELRNTGMIEKLINLGTRAYDKVHSEDGEGLAS